jgi:hypothetical protein
VRRMRHVVKVVCGGGADGACKELTWLANCVRRILSKLMVAKAEEWRGDGVVEVLGIFDARQEMAAATRYIVEFPPR